MSDDIEIHEWPNLTCEIVQGENVVTLNPDNAGAVMDSLERMMDFYRMLDPGEQFDE